VNEWLDGTTRFEMSDAQRAFWIDLLALAGRSRFPGRICAGEVGGSYVGYPLTKFQSLMVESIDVQQTLDLFENLSPLYRSVLCLRSKKNSRRRRSSRPLRERGCDQTDSLELQLQR
jgi:hypothetical protein